MKPEGPSNMRRSHLVKLPNSLLYLDLSIHLYGSYLIPVLITLRMMLDSFLTILMIAS